MNAANVALCVALAASTVAACSSIGTDDDVGQAQDELSLLGLLGQVVNTGSYSLHLENTLRFNKPHPDGDVEEGRILFGLTSDLEAIDPTAGLFEGFSVVAGKEIVSNGRNCATCHRSLSVSLGMPAPPLSDTIPLTDPLFTGIDADAQSDPDGFENLDQHGLFKYRPGRFNQTRSQDDPFRKVFFWRKSPALVNLVFSRGFLLDGRMRLLFETDQGAVLSHTQNEDGRFDDLFTVQNARDLEAFQFSLLSDPALEALLDKGHPNHQALAQQPFATVPINTLAQWRGRNVFIRDCLVCHSTPNVFNNLSNVQPLGDDIDRPPMFPPFGPNVGRAFNIGVSERNKHGLRFSVPLEGGGFETIVLQLAKESGAVDNHAVTFDVGLASVTRRSEDVGRFKVPQLRNIRNLAPYFHDNSADTLEEVVDYFNSNHYNHSRDGKKNKIHQSPKERADLLEFLQIL